MAWNYLAQLEEVEVTGVRTTPYKAVQVGIKNKNPRKVNSGLLGQFRKNNVNPKYKVAEFKVTEDALVAPGELNIFHAH
jgi:large subunit ribosomal protein L3